MIKFLKKLISNSYYLILLMIPFGWFLNAYYYLLRYESEGFNDIVKYILSVSLVIVASICFGAFKILSSKKKKGFWITLIIYVILAIYSINCTTAGQYWEQQKKNEQTDTNKTEQENQQFLIERYKKKIEIAETEYLQLNEIKYTSIDDMSDRFYYRNTTKSVEQRQAELQEIITDYEKKIESILSENKISAKSEDIKQSKQLYEFYSNLIYGNAENTEIIQFIFQLLLSILIELIAQVSIYIFLKMNDTSSIIKDELKYTRNEIIEFTKNIYKLIHEKKSDYLVDKNAVLKLMNHGFSEKKYDDLIKIAKKNKLIIKHKEQYKPESVFIDRTVFCKNLCEILQIDLT